jgi:cation diffusion facilitator family transporter
MIEQPISQRAFRWQALILGIGLLLLGGKLLAWWLTGSNGVLTDALESIINVLAGAFALYSLNYASRPHDSNHPYGHGKIEFLSSGLEGLLILTAGGLMIGKAIHDLFQPGELAYLGWGVLLTASTGAVNGLLGWLAQRQGQRLNSQVLKAEGQHLLSDAWSSLGLIVGLGLIWLTDLMWLDQVVAIGFGLLIAYTGLGIMRRAVAGVMDEADEEVIDQLVPILQQHRQDEWIDIHNLRVIRYGTRLHIDCHLTLPWYFSLERAHVEVKAVEALLDEQLSMEVECFIHTDPCQPSACPICPIQSCPKRQLPFVGQRRDWTAQQLRSRERHGVAPNSS